MFWLLNSIPPTFHMAPTTKQFQNNNHISQIKTYNPQKIRHTPILTLNSSYAKSNTFNVRLEIGKVESNL